LRWGKRWEEGRWWWTKARVRGMWGLGMRRTLGARAMREWEEAVSVSAEQKLISLQANKMLSNLVGMGLYAQ